MELTRVFEKEELLNMQSFYQRNDCSRRTAIELAAALLEARELIKEMREVLNQCDSDIMDSTCDKVVAILEKSKDYAN